MHNVWNCILRLTVQFPVQYTVQLVAFVLCTITNNSINQYWWMMTKECYNNNGRNHDVKVEEEEEQKIHFQLSSNIFRDRVAKHTAFDAKTMGQILQNRTTSSYCSYFPFIHVINILIFLYWRIIRCVTHSCQSISNRWCRRCRMWTQTRATS